MSERVQYKVVLLGEGAVGKTSLVLRYTQNKFNPQHDSTLQAAYTSKNLTVMNHRVQLNIWDTAGQERYHALGPIYYRESHGALVVFDITDVDSFQKAKKWIKELQKMISASLSLTLVGNKMDLEKNRQIKYEEGKEYASSVGAEYIETSAKQNKNIEEMFLSISKRMISAHGTSSGVARKPASSNSTIGVTLSDDSEQISPSNGSKGCGC